LLRIIALIFHDTGNGIDRSLRAGARDSLKFARRSECGNSELRNGEKLPATPERAKRLAQDSAHLEENTAG